MAEILDFESLKPTCQNCRWSDHGTCRCPGGWYWDERYRRCATFKRKTNTPEGLVREDGLTI